MGLLAFRHGWLVVDQDPLGIAEEGSLDSVDGVIVLVVKFVKLLKLEVSARGPVETFFWELVLVRVGNSEANVVVLVDALNTTPKEEFLAIVLGRTVEQLLDSVLQLELLLAIESDSIVANELKGGVQIKNVHIYFL